MAAGVSLERVTNFDDLLAFLGEEQAAFRHDAAAQIVQLPTSSGAADGSLFIRWERHVPLVQLVAPMIHDVPDERVHELEDAVCRVNHAVLLPGFGYDFAKRFLYFRLTLARDDEGIRAALLRKMLFAVVNNARDYLAPFRAIVAGEPAARIGQLVRNEERARQMAMAENVGTAFKD
jgi:hypothetical protein